MKERGGEAGRVEPCHQPADLGKPGFQVEDSGLEHVAGLGALQQQGEAVVALVEELHRGAGWAPEGQGVAFAGQLGVVLVAARVQLEHDGTAVPFGRAGQRDHAAVERLDALEAPRGGGGGEPRLDSAASSAGSVAGQ